MEVIERYELDAQGRMKYNPEFHFSHKQPFTESDLEYMCKYYETDGRQKIGFAIGKTEGTVDQKIQQLKKDGLYEYYKNLNKHW